jgi:predicted DNA-binding ribbon-helix-helix protein
VSRQVPLDPATIAGQRPETRVVTHEGQRTSVRLEPAFWRVLEEMAADQGVRVGRLIGRLADGRPTGNLTAHLRTVCLLEAQRRRATGQLDDRWGDVSKLIHWAPTPALIAAGDTTILDQNPALDTWLGQPSLIGLTLTDAFRVRSRKPLRELWTTMQESGRPIAGLGLVRISAGRVQAAEATVVPTDRAADTRPAVVWLAVRGSRVTRG